MRKLKLIWDFRGPVSQKTAEHHLVHLKEYIELNKNSKYLLLGAAAILPRFSWSEPNLTALG